MTKKNNQKSVTVGFVSLGCPKNVVDSEKMLALIAQAGLLITAEPGSADVIVINTCGFIAPAITESLEAIKQAVDCKAAGTVKKVIVAGCLCERLGRELFSRADGIDAIVGLDRRDDIAGIIKKTIHSNKRAVFLGHSSRTTSSRMCDDRARLLITPGHWAYLRISQGCNHRCSFCTIPSIRGQFRSKAKQLILAEANELVCAGAVELNIIAQDTASYGRDMKTKNGLSKLLKELEKIPDLAWIRLMYLYPAGISDELIETVAASEKIVHYLDIPIQHINDKILKNMRRPDSKERICRLIEKLRSDVSDIVLRTTLIVGFPGETGRQFDELSEFVKWAEFDALGCFKYYPESGTPAAEMPHQVPDRIKQQRVKELMLIQQKIAFAKNKSRIATKLTCLVDSVDNKSTAKARFYGQAPDIDSVCIIKEPVLQKERKTGALKSCLSRPGQFVETKVVATKDYDLLVKQI